MPLSPDLIGRFSFRNVRFASRRSADSALDDLNDQAKLIHVSKHLFEIKVYSPKRPYRSIVCYS